MAKDCLQLVISFILLLSSLAISQQGLAKIQPHEIPDALKPWQAWVLYPHSDRACPMAMQNAAQRFCQWPSQLKLSVQDTGAQFTVSAMLFRDDWLELPGDTKNWPQSVRVNNKLQVVIEKQGHPAIYLQKGNYELTGNFNWKIQPTSLTMPSHYGLITLKRNEKLIPFPERDQNQLWLAKREITEQKGEPSLNLRVFRRFRDGVPVMIDTQLQLIVSGPDREQVFEKTNFNDTLPTLVSSDLPAQLDKNGNLRVRLKAGQWNIQLANRFLEDPESLQAIKRPSPWPEDEIWVFASDQRLRQWRVTNATAIDPKQSLLPRQWRKLPAYQVHAGENIKLEKHAATDANKVNHLQLSRQMWLDFRGEGYTLSDNLNGQMQQGWRLNMDEQVDLGRVTLNGQEQLITTRANDKRPGVEVRQGNLNLQAVSRYNTSLSTVPVTGWDQKFEQVNTLLYLPPAWTLFHATGVDQVSNAWLSSWSLLDIFLLLLIVIGVSRVINKPWGIVTALVLLLSHNHFSAPLYTWLNIVLTLGLLQLVPQGKFKRVLWYYKNLSFLLLIVIALPFMVLQLQSAIYPQLERDHYYQPYAYQQMLGKMRYVKTAPAALVSREAPRRIAGASAKMSFDAGLGMHAEESLSQSSIAGGIGGAIKLSAQANLASFDPNARVQTGPALPEWQRQPISLRWLGAIAPGQKFSLYLVKPSINRFLNVINVLLIIILSLRLWGLRYRRGHGFNFAAAKFSILVLAIGLLGFSPTTVQAQNLPSPELLRDLQQRLLEKPSCLPKCASLSRLNISMNNETLQLELTVSNQEALALPLPVVKGIWQPENITVDDMNNAVIKGYTSDKYQLYLPAGTHKIMLSGAIAPVDVLRLPLPVVPNWVDANISGWSVSGLTDGHISGSYLHFNRLSQLQTQTQESERYQASAVPAFVRITRTLHLGKQWLLVTRVDRLAPVSPQLSPIHLEVPLLASESLLSENIQQHDGKVVVDMPPNVYTQTWQSTLKQDPELVLTALKNKHWTHNWRLDAAPIWHFESEGVTPLQQQTQQVRIPEWLPQPGQTLKLVISRPATVAGQTLTIDSSNLEMQADPRGQLVNLKLKLRSSLGVQHPILLPKDAKLQSLHINNKNTLFQQQDDTLVLPIAPGRSDVRMVWRSPKPLSTKLVTPIVNLGQDSSNSHIAIKLPQKRWIIALGGPALGPAILFWGLLSLVILLAFGLGRLALSPLKTRHWLLLGIGMSASSPYSLLIIIAWIFALALRRRAADIRACRFFKLQQVGLVLLTFVSLIVLINVIQAGLLATPDMKIAGLNYAGNQQYLLQWFQDQTSAELPTAWILSFPMWIYRIAMLLWALWLAFALLKWLRWGWECFSNGGYWYSAAKVLESSDKD